MTQPQYLFKTTPFKHQLEEWERSREETARAIFWEQGTGKSKLIIDTACWLWSRGLIDAVLVVAPNGVHRNWVENEIPDHVPDEIAKDVAALHYQSPRADTKWHQKAMIRTLSNANSRILDGPFFQRQKTSARDLYRD